LNDVQDISNSGLGGTTEMHFAMAGLVPPLRGRSAIGAATARSSTS
jgi:hypothetical protein